MTAPKHTPGPWRVGELSREVITPRGLSVCQAPESNGPEDDAAWDVDARLIAAAPDMLKMLEMISNHPGFVEVFEKSTTRRVLLSLIAKATGGDK